MKLKQSTSTPRLYFDSKAHHYCLLLYETASREDHRPVSPSQEDKQSIINKEHRHAPADTHMGKRQETLEINIWGFFSARAPLEWVSFVQLKNSLDVYTSGPEEEIVLMTSFIGQWPALTTTQVRDRLLKLGGAGGLDCTARMNGELPSKKIC